jgi:hypothetical protein
MIAIFPANVYAANQFVGGLQMPSVPVRLTVQVILRSVVADSRLGNSKAGAVYLLDESIRPSRGTVKFCGNPTSRQKRARCPDFRYAAPPTVACAAFFKESRMKFIRSA